MPVPGFVLDLDVRRTSSPRCSGAAQRVMPRRTLDLGYEFQHPELDEALRDLLG